MKNKVISTQKQADEILEKSRIALRGFIQGSGLQLTSFQQKMFLTGFAGGVVSQISSGKEADLLNQSIANKIFS